jgi:hypothetical protein
MLVSLLLLFSKPPAATEATVVIAKHTEFLLLKGFAGGDSLPTLVELLLLSILFPLRYLGGGCTVAEVTADEGLAGMLVDVIFLGDEWKPNRFLFALLGLIVAVGGGFLLIEGEDVDVFVDIRLPVADD